MGVELFIMNINQPLVEKYLPLFERAIKRRDVSPVHSTRRIAAQREVEEYYEMMYSDGYFYDSYYATGIAWRLGFCWQSDVQPLCTKDCRLLGNNLEKFLDIVASVKMRPPIKKEIENHHGLIDDRGQNSLPKWQVYFERRQSELIRFLKRAFLLNTAIHCFIGNDPQKAKRD